MPKCNIYQQEKINNERSLSVYKRDDMIQKGRFKLSVQEQRAVLYAISKIKPTDTHLTEYIFDIKDFYRVIGWKNESYTEFKALLKGLTDKSWWAEIDDNGTESVLRWFTTARSNKRSGKVTVKFHEDMMPFLLQVAEQGEFYTFYNLKYVLPMSSKHSPRLYEILKSYQKNNRQWFFDIDKLKKLMDCENYNRWPDFRRYALDPAVEEINKYTDICIAYTAVKEGRKVTRIVFYMDNKTLSERLETETQINEVLDGQLDIFDMIDDNHNSVKTDFYNRRSTAFSEYDKQTAEKIYYNR